MKLTIRPVTIAKATCRVCGACEEVGTYEPFSPEEIEEYFTERGWTDGADGDVCPGCGRKGDGENADTH